MRFCLPSLPGCLYSLTNLEEVLHYNETSALWANNAWTRWSCYKWHCWWGLFLTKISLYHTIVASSLRNLVQSAFKKLTFWKYTTRISLIFEALRRLSGEIRTVSVQNPVSEHNLVLGAKQELPLGQDHSSKIAQNSPLQQGVSMKPEWWTIVLSINHPIPIAFKIDALRRLMMPSR